jgi:hypothetical protein
MATMGRLMKNLDMDQSAPAPAASGKGLTETPSRTFCTPSTTTISPFFTPLSMIHSVPTRSPTLTMRTLTLLSLPTTAS